MSTRVTKRMLAGERGSVPLFFAAFLLPTLFFLLSISIDLAAFRHETESAQRIADDAAMFGYRFLPYREAAISAAKSYIERYAGAPQGSSVSIAADGVEIAISRDAVPLFGSFFSASALGLPVRAISRVRGSPIDAFIVLDASSYMGPQLEAAEGWGNPVEWPVSRNIAERVYELSIQPRVATQRCFNEGFAALKLAAIRAFDHLAGFSLNALGAGVHSGGSVPIEVVRPVKGFSELPIAVGMQPEADFLAGSHPWFDSVDCAAAAESFDAPEQFQLPAYSIELPSRGTFRNRPATMVAPSGRSISSDYLPYLQAREVIWSQIARPPQSGSSAELIKAAFSELLRADPMSQRKGLIDSPIRSAILFSGDLPRQGGAVFPDSAVDGALRSALRGSFLDFGKRSKEAVRSQLLYIVLQHEGIPDRSADVAALQRLFDEETSLSGLSPDKFQGRVFYVRDAAEATRVLLQSLTLLNKTSVLSL